MKLISCLKRHNKTSPYKHAFATTREDAELLAKQKQSSCADKKNHTSLQLVTLNHNRNNLKHNRKKVRFDENSPIKYSPTFGHLNDAYGYDLQFFPHQQNLSEKQLKKFEQKLKLRREKESAELKNSKDEMNGLNRYISNQDTSCSLSVQLPELTKENSEDNLVDRFDGCDLKNWSQNI